MLGTFTLRETTSMLLYEIEKEETCWPCDFVISLDIQNTSFRSQTCDDKLLI